MFREVRRVLRDDGTCWINLGDSYAGSWGNYGSRDGKQRGGRTSAEWTRPAYDGDQGYTDRPGTARVQGLPDKNLIGIPWRVAFALQDVGWILRSDVIWSKPNCMPESVTDRPTRSHEYLFLFAKQARYFYDALAIAEPSITNDIRRPYTSTGAWELDGRPEEQRHRGEVRSSSSAGQTRNRRTVWTIATQPYSGAHFATMPEALIEPCILAGSSAQACETCGAAWGWVVERSAGMQRDRTEDEGLPETMNAHGIRKLSGKAHAEYKALNPDRDLGFAPRCACADNTGSARSVVLDPFGGSGTVARVADRFGRDAILIDLNQSYIELQEQRTNGVQKELFV